MDQALAPDSPLIRFLTRVADLMILNLLFVATAVPIVTLGPSLTALHYTAARIRAGHVHSVTADYLRSFRQNFRQGALTGAALGFVGVVVGAWYLVLQHPRLPAIGQLVGHALWFLLAFRFVIAALFAFPYLATFDDRVVTVLNNARLMSLKHLLASLTVLTVTGLPVVITVFYPAMSGYGLVWFLIGFAGIAYVNAPVFADVFGRYAEI